MSLVAFSFIKPTKKAQPTKKIEECLEDRKLLDLLLVQLYNTECSTEDLNFLKNYAQQINLCYTEEDIQFIEAVSRLQSKCDAWRKLRAGRVTASIFKAVCRTNLKTPSLSLLKRICYPHLYKFYFIYV